MGTSLQVLRTQGKLHSRFRGHKEYSTLLQVDKVSSEQQDDVQGRSPPFSHCCGICCSRGEVLMRGTCTRDARSGGDGEDGGDPHSRLHPRQLLPHSRLHRSSALL